MSKRVLCNSPSDVRQNIYKNNAVTHGTNLCNLTKVPSSVKILVHAWMFKKRHDFCDIENIKNMNRSLLNFDISYKADGTERRSPSLCIENGVTMPCFKFMKYYSACKLHWSCELCGLSICSDPQMVSKGMLCLPCHPILTGQIEETPEYMREEDYLFYYLTQPHLKLKMVGIDPKPLILKFKKESFSGIAETLVYKEAMKYKHGREILEYLDFILDLKGGYKEYLRLQK